MTTAASSACHRSSGTTASVDAFGTYAGAVDTADSLFFERLLT